MKNTNDTNPIIQRGFEIGKFSAENDDEYLFDCFIETPALNALKSLESPTMIISGRTGSGKTALLRYIEQNEQTCLSVDPFEISMQYVASSDILKFLHDIGADLDLLFQTLWKHILCLQFISICFDIKDKKKSENFFNKLFSLFSNTSHRQEAINYLHQYHDKFWVTMDENVKEMLDVFEKQFETELSAEIKKIKAKANYAKQLSEIKKTEIIHRIKKIINGEQLAKLSKVLDLLKDPKVNDSAKRHFILLDQLDRNWVDDSVRFRLIRALIDSLQTFRKIRNLKIIVALRTDVIERVTIETQQIVTQREKYEDFTVRLSWGSNELKELVDKRISFLFKKKYTNAAVVFDDLFKRKVDGQTPFDYLIDRTHMRPRDILAFINECFKQVQNTNEVTAGAIKEAEKEYSRIRYQALCDEWRSVYPSLNTIITSFVRSAHGKSFGEIPTKEVWEEMIVNIVGDETLSKDPLYKQACNAFNNSSTSDIINFAKEVVSILYRLGIISVKNYSDETFQLSDKSRPIIDASLINNETKIRLHPMLLKALHVTDQRRAA